MQALDPSDSPQSGSPLLPLTLPQAGTRRILLGLL